MGEPAYLVVGLLRRSHGLRGDMLMEVYTDFPERLAPGKTLYVGDEHRPLVIRNVRPVARGVLIGFEGFIDPESTAVLRNRMIYTAATELPALPAGEYYHHQLIGLRVVNQSGQFLGILEEIIQTGAKDVYSITTPEGSEILIPAVDDFILEISLERHEIIVAPPEWE